MTQPNTRGVPIRGTDRLIVAIDVTASMATVDAENETRLSRAKLVLSDLIRRLPRDTPVTVLTVGASVRELARDATPIQARAALLLADANAGSCLPGIALEQCFTMYLRGGKGYKQYEQANFVLVTDGEPDDMPRWVAWSLYNLYGGEPLTVTVLTCGELRDYPIAAGRIDASARGIVLPLDEAEFQISTPTGSDRPGDDEAPKRPTVPPSLSPPLVELLPGDHQSARQAADAVAPEYIDERTEATADTIKTHAEIIGEKISKPVRVAREFMRTETVNVGPENAGSFDKPRTPPSREHDRPTKPEHGGYLKGKSPKRK